jgi:hypothetical protein
VKTFVCLLTLYISNGLAEPQPSTSLSLENISQRYCVGDEDVGQILIVGQLRYQNVSQVPVLLLRKRHSVESIRLQPINPRPGSKEKEHRISISSDLGDLNAKAPSSEKDFVRLPVGGAYTERTVFSLPFQKARRKYSGDLAADGAYWLSIDVSIWPGTMEEAADLKKTKFKNTDVLTQPLWSKPVRIEIRSDAPTQSCDPE